MALQRLTQSVTTSILDRATVKSHLRVDHDAEDALIDLYAAAAVRTAERRTARTFGTATWRLTLATLPGVIVLQRPCITAVSLMTVVDSNGVVETIAAEDRRLISGDWNSYLQPATGITWPTPAALPDAVTVEFTETFGTAEGDLKAALLLIAGHLYRNREAVSADSLHEVPMAVDMLLAPYRTEFV